MTLLSDEIRAAKEKFVFGHLGTDDWEMLSLGAAVIGALAASQAINLLMYQSNKQLRSQSIKHCIIEFALIVCPILAAFTVAADHLIELIVGEVLVLIACYIFTSFNQQPTSPQTTDQSINQPINLSRQFLSLYRASLLLTTAVAILAVDFTAFPRRFAKTETYGISPMDAGVGGFMFANALVSWPARRAAGLIRSNNQSNNQTIYRSIARSILPLLTLGIIRLVTTKAANYQEHASEYGRHWNFFFTLAVVTLLAFLTQHFLTARRSLVIGLTLASINQFVLSIFDVSSLIMSTHRSDNLIDANREGLISIVGFYSLYLIGLFVGSNLLIDRSINQWKKLIIQMFGCSLIVWLIERLIDRLIEPVSRRLMNAGYLCLTLWFNLFILASCMTIIVLSKQYQINKQSNKQTINQPTIQSNHQNEVSRSINQSSYHPLIVQLIDRRPLLFFLLSNLLTGLTNVLMSCHTASNEVAMMILSVYLASAIGGTYIVDRLLTRQQRHKTE